MTHPTSLDLEAFAVGEPLPAQHVVHVEECTACAAFLEKVRGVVSAGPSAEEADAAVARAVARLTTKAPAADPAPASATRAERDPRRRMWLVGSSVVAPLAAAAAILLLTRSPDTSGGADPANGDPRPQTTYKVQMATLTPAVAPVAPARLVVEPDTQFKGGMQVAVVRERGNAQTRFSSTVRVRPGDRLRVEVALDHEQAILGAVLADDGSYLELMPQAVRGPGTHFSERSAKIDAAPTRGTILIGSPEAVARARETKNFEGVTTLRVDPEAP